MVGLVNFSFDAHLDHARSGMSIDVGFCEADIVASIEEAAQGHIKWIYDCLMARIGNETARRLTKNQRHFFMKRSVKIYLEYMRDTLKNTEENFL